MSMPPLTFPWATPSSILPDLLYGNLFDRQPGDEPAERDKEGRLDIKRRKRR